MGNTYDLAALVALTTGAVVLVLCLSCGWALYCLPVAPIIAGAIALVSATRAVDPERTRLHAWLGIGGGGLGLLIMITGMLLYFCFMALYIAFIWWVMNQDASPDLAVAQLGAALLRSLQDLAW
jgi:hypothetical protein